MRYYEAHGILPAPSRLPNGYRVYGEHHVELLRFVRRAQSFGLTLKEIEQLVMLALHGKRACGRVRELAREHLKAIDRRIEQLELLRTQLRRMLRRRAGRDSGAVCPLIETVDDKPLPGFVANLKRRHRKERSCDEPLQGSRPRVS